MFWLLPLAGAAIGAMANKKKPLQGALMGAGIGATGGLLAPAAAGGAAAAGAGAAGAGGAAASAAPAMVNGAFLGEGVASGIPAWQAAASGGSGAGGLLGTMSQYAKPAGQALQMAQQSGMMGGEDQQAQPSPMLQQATGGPQTLASIVQQGDQETQGLLMGKRKRRPGLFGREYS